MVDQSLGQNPTDQSESLVASITPQSCDVCSASYHKAQDTIIKCGHKIPIASLAATSQSNLGFDHGYANGKPVRILRDTGSTVFGISRHLLSTDDITDKSLKCVTFGDTFENFKLTIVHISTP